MVYTIGETAKQLGITASALRYYDREGLLPFVERSSGGIRMFGEADFEWLKIIDCMKKTGMSVKQIRQYIEMALEGDDTINQRLELFRNQRDELKKQMNELQKAMKTVEYKCWYYETAKAAGTTDALENMKESEIPERFREIRRELKNLKA